MTKRRVTIDLEQWPFAGRPRVLIEHFDAARALELAGALRQAGCTVGVCCGPDAAADPATRCPLHGLEPCVAVEGADLVVTALDLDTTDGVGVVRGLRTRYRETPAVVLATVAQTLALEDVLDDCTVLPINGEPTYVATAVRALLGDHAFPAAEHR
jgi:DNA-binding response OmpR family regulator